MNQVFIDQDVVTECRDGVGVITLNRPKALNALSLEMVRKIAATLKAWEQDDAVSCVVFVGAGERAFCAGGDVKAFYHSGMEYRRGQVDLRVPTVFFGEEYSLNKQIFHYSKPTIAFMDGIVMGGGYGIAGHCQHRIATERTVFAMPEVGIGFFPDVGAVYHLNQVPRNFGRYLALTGRSIGAGDMLAAGLADVYVDSKGYYALLSDLRDGEDIDTVLTAHKASNPDAEIITRDGDVIEAVFAHDSIVDIFEALRKAEKEFSEKTFEFFAKASPLSVAVTLQHLKAMQNADFDVVIEADFLLAQRFIEYPDLYEGIRAVVIQKDKKPVWEPPIFNGVSDDDVARYFKPTGYTLNDVRIFAT